MNLAALVDTRLSQQKAMCIWMEVDIQQFSRTSLFYIHSECFGRSKLLALERQWMRSSDFSIIDKTGPTTSWRCLSGFCEADVVVFAQGFRSLQTCCSEDQQTCSFSFGHKICSAWTVDNHDPTHGLCRKNGCHDKMKTFSGKRLEWPWFYKRKVSGKKSQGFPLAHSTPGAKKKHVCLQLGTHLVVNQSSVSNISSSPTSLWLMIVFFTGMKKIKRCEMLAKTVGF